MCVCVCASARACARVRAHACVFWRAYVRACMWVSQYTYNTYIYIHIYTYISLTLRIYAYIYIYIMCIYMYALLRIQDVNPAAQSQISTVFRTFHTDPACSIKICVCVCVRARACARARSCVCVCVCAYRILYITHHCVVPEIHCIWPSLYWIGQYCHSPKYTRLLLLLLLSLLDYYVLTSTTTTRPLHSYTMHTNTTASHTASQYSPLHSPKRTASGLGHMPQVGAAIVNACQFHEKNNIKICTAIK